MEERTPEFREFSVRGLHGLVRNLKQDPSIMEGDWREVAKATFGMTEQQKAFLDSCPDDLHNRLQQSFSEAAEHVRAGGTVQLKVVQEDASVRALYLLSSPETQGDVMSSALIGGSAIQIICCDAHCGDWEWCAVQ
jgi:hypothetical protein